MRTTLTALLVALSLTSLARATVLLPADLDELVDHARAIAHGRIVDVRAQWAEGRRRIDSLVTIEIEQYLKGDLGREVVFFVPGGDMGRYRSVIVGAPSFEPGDEVVLFLGARGPSIPYVLGLSQGVFRVVRDARSGEALVTPPALFAVGGEEARRVERGDPARRPLPLDDFAGRVRSLLARRRP